MFFESFIFFIISFLFGASTLVIGARNPIHSILILILVFFLGSILLFLLSMEYFAILFLIVYVGAIVVLFLFIVMMLEIKMVNTSERFSDLFSFKNIILAFLVLEILFFSNEEFWDVTPVFQTTDTKFNWNITEVNLYTDYSKVLTYIGQLKAIGGILFSHYLIAIILISILLFISMFGSIVMTLESTKRIIIKQQDATLQGMRAGGLKALAYFYSANVITSKDGSTSIIGGIYSFMVAHPVATGIVALATLGGVMVLAAPIVTPIITSYVAPFITQILGGGAAATSAVTGALTGGTQTPFIPGGFGKTLEIGTALAPASSVATDIAAVAATTVAAAVTRNVVTRVVDAFTQTGGETPIATEAPVREIVVSSVETEQTVLRDVISQTDEVPAVVVESPEILARLASAEEANAKQAIELAEAQATIARLELEAQSLNSNRVLLERAALEGAQKTTDTEAIIDTFNARYASDRATINVLRENLETATATLRELSAHNSAAGGGAGGGSHSGAIGSEPGTLKGVAINKFLSGSESASIKDIKMPGEVHDKLYKGFEAVLDHLTEVKQARGLDTSNIEEFSDADALAIEQLIREIFTLIIDHFC